MLYAIRDLFTPPQIQDTRRKQQASLVYAAIVLTVVLSITGMLAGAFINSGNWRVLLTDAIIIALELFSLWILSRGRRAGGRLAAHQRAVAGHYDVYRAGRGH